MKTIANSSVLIALSSIGQLTLLAQRFPEGILVPPAVWQEVVTSGTGRAGATEVRSAPWLLVREVKESGLLTLLRTTAGNANDDQWQQVVNGKQLARSPAEASSPVTWYFGVSDAGVEALAGRLLVECVLCTI